MSPLRIIRAALSRRRHARAAKAMESYAIAALAFDDARRRRDTRSIHRAEQDLRAARTEMLRIGA